MIGGELDTEKHENVAIALRSKFNFHAARARQRKHVRCVSSPTARYNQRRIAHTYFLRPHTRLFPRINVMWPPVYQLDDRLRARSVEDGRHGIH
jgi:hypothetical protein